MIAPFITYAAFIAAIYHIRPTMPVTGFARVTDTLATLARLELYRGKP